MADAVVHFEITGSDPDRLREYYGALFGWRFENPSTVATEIAEPGRYHFLDLIQKDGVGIRGGIAGGVGFVPRTIFYIGVDDVADAVRRAEELGGTCVLGPATAPNGLVVAHVADPEGAIVGLAGG